MIIALDAMGGDHAPGEIIKGAIDAARELGVEVVLVGQEEGIQPSLARYDLRGLGVSVVDAPEVVGMGEHPVRAVRQKPNSSLVVAMGLLKQGEASALVSAGNSGAIMAAALFALGRIEGVERPAIGTVFPVSTGPVLLLDSGANTDCKASFLVQFAHMGSVYMQRVFGIPHPRLALLSNGEEETKGNQLVRESHQLLKATELNFRGNVEGKDILRGVADVVVTDGFTGNVVLKVTEGLSAIFVELLKQTLNKKPHLWAASFPLRPALQAIAQQLDYSEYGGAPLLGVDGTVIIAHGRSDAKAIKNAVRMAKREVDQGMLDALRSLRLSSAVEPRP